MFRESSSRGAGGGALSDGATVRPRIRASRPLPSTLRVSSLLMIEDLLGEFDIALRSLGSGIVAQDGLAKARGLGQPDTAGDDCAEDLVLEELPQVIGDLPGEVGPVVEHREKDAGDLQGMAQPFANAIYG